MRNLRPLLLVTAATAAAAVLAATTPGVALARPTDPVGVVRHARSPGAIPGRYIVVFKNTDDVRKHGVRGTATELTKEHGGSLRRVFGEAVKGFSAVLSEAEAEELATDPDVAFVEQDQMFHISETQRDATWGLDRIDQRELPLNGSYDYPATASDVHAYIIDTGVLTTHTEFGGRATSGYDFVDNDPDTTDCHGHGTHVAGTVGGATYGVAKGVQIVGVRVLDCHGDGTTEHVIAGVDWVTANAVKPAVANMSLGGGVSDALDTAVANSIASGVTYAVAAGNAAADACYVSPARIKAAITVGAADWEDTAPRWSNWGTCVDVYAPGQEITSAWNDSDTGTLTTGGTSMASPHVAGAAALILADHPSYSPEQVASALLTSATRKVIEYDSYFNGSPDLLLHTGPDETATG